MYLMKGVGLSAPQVGINERLVVVNAEGARGKGQPEHELVLVNPKVNWTGLDWTACWQSGL
jgi:peptide deformylase